MESEHPSLALIDQWSCERIDDPRLRAWLTLLHGERDRLLVTCFDATLTAPRVSVDTHGRISDGSLAMSWPGDAKLWSGSACILFCPAFLGRLSIDRPPHRQRAADVLLHELIHVALFAAGHRDHWHGPLFVTECNRVGAIRGLAMVSADDAEFWPAVVRSDGFYEDALPSDWRSRAEEQRRRMAVRQGREQAS